MAATLRQIIAHTASKEYLLNFSTIDPHGLSKICHTLLISFEEMQEQEGADKSLPINDAVMIEGMIDCMRRIRLELAIDEIAVFVRSSEQFARASKAIEQADCLQKPLEMRLVDGIAIGDVERCPIQ